MIPGDSFNFKKVTKQFLNISIDDQTIKETTWNYYEKTGITSKCDFQLKIEKNNDFVFKEKMVSFLKQFDDFVMKRVHKTNFNSDIVGFKIVLKSNLEEESIIIGGNQRFNNKTATFHIEEKILQMLLTGKIIWENLYIGHQCEVETLPLETNIRAPVRWLASFGYVYQRGCINV